MISQVRFLIVPLCWTILLTQNCSNDTKAAVTAASFKYNGTYIDAVTSTQTISNTAWNSAYPGLGTCARSVSSFDSTNGFALYKEGATVCFNANKYGKVFFTTDASASTYFCDFVSGKATSTEVTAVTTKPTTTTPATSGCNGVAWTKLNKTSTNFDLVGTFVDLFGGTYTFTNTSWADSFGCTKDIIFYDNANAYFLYQEQAGGCFNAYKFGKVFWTIDSTKKLYYCEFLFGQNGYLATANDTTKPTYTTPSTSGCGGFSWSQIIKQ